MRGLILSCCSNRCMQPFTRNCAMELLPILNKPNLIYTIEMLKKSDIRDLVIIAGDTYPQLQRLLGNGERWGVDIQYQFQNQLSDPLDAIKGFQTLMQEEDFVVALGEYYLEVDMKAMLEEHYENRNAVTIALSQQEKLLGLYNYIANAGMFIFDGKKTFQVIESMRSKSQNGLKLLDVVQGLLEAGGRLGYNSSNGKCVYLESPSDLMRVNLLKLRGTPDSNKGIVDSTSTILGEVIIEEGARIFNSILQGPLFIGRDTLILNSFIGEDACIGERCEIVDASIFKSIVFSDTNIYHFKEPISYQLIGYNSILDLTSFVEVSISNIKGRGI